MNEDERHDDAQADEGLSKADDLLADVGLRDQNPPENEGVPALGDVESDYNEPPATDADIDEVIALVRMGTSFFWGLTGTRLGLDADTVERLSDFQPGEELALRATAPGVVPMVRRLGNGTGGPWPFIGALAMFQITRALTMKREAEKQYHEEASRHGAPGPSGQQPGEASPEDGDDQVTIPPLAEGDEPFSARRDPRP